MGPLLYKATAAWGHGSMQPPLHEATAAWGHRCMGPLLRAGPSTHLFPGLATMSHADCTGPAAQPGTGGNLDVHVLGWDRMVRHAGPHASETAAQGRACPAHTHLRRCSPAHLPHSCSTGDPAPAAPSTWAGLQGGQGVAVYVDMHVLVWSGNPPRGRGPDGMPGACVLGNHIIERAVLS
eukprot:365694-Chlamydomonas_euryale.AAC.8